VVDDAQDDPAAACAGGQQRRRPGGRVPQRVGGQVRDDAFHDRWVDHDPGQARRKAYRDHGCLRLLPGAVEAAGDDLPQIGRLGKHGQHAGLQAAHVQQAGKQPGELVQRLIGGGQELPMILGGQLDVVRTQAADRCLRRGQRRAEVVANRGEQDPSHPVGLRDGPGRGRLPGVPQGEAAEQGDREHRAQDDEHRGGQVQSARQLASFAGPHAHDSSNARRDH